MYVRRLTVDTIFPAIQELAAEHYKEVPGTGKGFEFNPDIECYRLCEQEGLCLCLALFHEDKVVGYLVALSSIILHHKDKTLADTDCFYVAKEYRGKGGFAMLLDEYKRTCDEGGVDVIRVTCNELFSETGDMLDKHGFDLIERTFQLK